MTLRVWGGGVALKPFPSLNFIFPNKRTFRVYKQTLKKCPDIFLISFMCPLNEEIIIADWMNKFLTFINNNIIVGSDKLSINQSYKPRKCFSSLAIYLLF